MNKTSLYIFIGSLFLSIYAFVNSHPEITTFTRLLEVQNFFGILGVVGGVIFSWIGKSPVNGNTPTLAKLTGNGKTPVPDNVVDIDKK